MAYCRNCGSQINDQAVICPHCGVQQKPLESNDTLSSIKDIGGWGWGLLGFFVPIAGLIIYLLWLNDHPRNAKAAGKGALISVIVSLSFVVVYFIFFLIFLITGSFYFSF